MIFWLLKWHQKVIQIRLKRNMLQAGVEHVQLIIKVYGCDLMNGIDELVAGNVNETSFEEIWHSSPVFKKLRNITFDDLSGKCAECPMPWCGGGCRCSALELDQTLLGSELACFYNKEGDINL